MISNDFAPQTTQRKALNVNLDERIYGTIAEIGAGQEVARHFFQAGRASGTIAKTISAYDMTFSDEIYGREPSGRYVCESRLLRMLEHEYNLLSGRLQERRGSSSTFFAFANTVTTSSAGGFHTCNGWVGIRFQRSPGAPANDIILHVRMKDRFRLQQQEALGVLGVNLIFSAFFPPFSADGYIEALIENIGTERIEIDVLKFAGPEFQGVDNRIVGLNLVAQDVCKAMVFAPGNAQTLHLPDVIYKKHVLVSRGTFRPFTNANSDVIDNGFRQFLAETKDKPENSIVLTELTLHSLVREGQLDHQDFLQRVDALAALGFHVLVSNYDLYYQMKIHLRRYTQGRLGILIGARHLEKLFTEKFYSSLEGGILEGFSKLFDSNTCIYVYPWKTDQQCLTTKSFFPPQNLLKLYQYFLENRWIVDVAGCDDTKVSVHSSQVRSLLEAGDPAWKSLVPTKVVELIEKHGFFRSSSH